MGEWKRNKINKNNINLSRWRFLKNLYCTADIIGRGIKESRKPFQKWLIVGPSSSAEDEKKATAEQSNAREIEKSSGETSYSAIELNKSTPICFQCISSIDSQHAIHNNLYWIASVRGYVQSIVYKCEWSLP